MKILLVEDDKKLCRLLSECLGDEGLARAMLEECLWGNNTEKSDSAIESLIKRLRRHLGWSVKEGLLGTVTGEGNRLKIK